MAETRIRRISPGKDTRPARRRTARIPALKGPKGLYRTGMAKQGWHHVETPRPCIRHPLYPETGVFIWNMIFQDNAYRSTSAPRAAFSGCSPKRFAWLTVRRAAKGPAFGNRDFLKKIE
ncbi:hypothetical protein D7Y41_08190 [Anaerotruncus sp. 1XD22-93]|nr:hypothetical protein D7Y41_08190 [Anaerotruncus sp. 1XD22-93]